MPPGERNPPTPAVIYAAKSTEDKHGCIPAQFKDCRALAAHEGWRVVYEDKDEGFSAYKGNRGPGLARGAGDEPGAADHLMELFFWLGRQRVDLWSVQSGGKVDRIRALLEGERN